VKERAVGLACGLGAAALFLAGGLDGVERALDDARFRLLPRAATGDVVVVGIDARSLDRLDVWPWPRGYHATVLENLLAAGARRVAFDLDFSSRSIPEEDAAFATALAAAGSRAVLPVFRQWQAGAGATVLTAPLPALADAAALASINIRPEADGVVRRYRTHDDRSDGMAAMAVALQARPPAAPGEFHLDFGIDPVTVPRISYVDVLAGRFVRESVRGRAVIVGASAVELGDQVAVPVHSTLAGPLLQALAHESLASSRALRRMPPAAAAAVAVLLAALAGAPLQRAGWRRGAIALGLALAGLFAASLAAQAGAPLLLDVTPAALGLTLSFGVGLVRRIDRQGWTLLRQGERLRDTETIMRHVVENSLEAIVTVDEASRILSFNPAAERMFGFRADEAGGRPLGEMLAGGIPEGDGGAPREGTGRRRDGTTFVAETTVSGFDLGGRRRRVAFVRDVTRRRAQERALEHQATHDALTDLPNRVMLQRRMEEALAAAAGDGRPVAVLILDLDRFKEVNDTLGHQMGDDLLRRIGDRLRHPLRPADTIARVGGDEFAILLPDSGPREARAVARRLADALREPFELRGLSLQVDTSLGIAIFPDHGRDAAALLQRADVAMYAAKRRREPFAFYDAEEDFNSVRHLALRGELRRAVDEDHLILFYQPKIGTQTGRAAGAEALLRWRHPRHGLLAPDEFIPLAEHTGLIKPIVGWVLRSALRQCARWEAEGEPVPVSVNCSARNLLQEDLPETIGRALADCGLPADRLTLEITETVLIEDPRRALEVATELARLGVRISIDDFGTGYSSLDYLRKLPVREIKIDKSFVSGMDADEGGAVIVRSVIDLAHNLGLEAVAEGVETAAVWTLLRRLGCDLAQGYYFGRPAPAAEFLALLRAPTWPSLPRASARA
jgi:diguanylate cyclase (GGDEF)-like protein/PAS domain S-box-containing protein